MNVRTPQRRRRSLRGLIRERLIDIERRMQLGYRHIAIVEELAAEGYPMTLDVFRNALYDARRRARLSGPATPAAPQALPRKAANRQGRSCESPSPPRAGVRR